MTKTTAVDRTILVVEITSSDASNFVLEQTRLRGADQAKAQPTDVHCVVNRARLVPMRTAPNARVMRAVEQKRRPLPAKPRIDHVGGHLTHAGSPHAANSVGATA